MKTKILSINNNSPEAKKIKIAADLLRAGEIVAFPTETVYGLGADATNSTAIRKIFVAKNRPADNPLIVHISDTSQLEKIVSKVPLTAQMLIKTFWPGPLSIVLPKHKDIPNITTGNLDTVVVRFPSHPIAKALIQATKLPIAAPSANLSGKVSPTRSAHVVEDLAGKIPLIIDGGDIEFGLESTVVDCTIEPPAVLRPGSVTHELLKLVIPNIKEFSSQDAKKSPGTKYRHYSTNTPIILFDGSAIKTAICLEKYLQKHSNLKHAVLWHTSKKHVFSSHNQLPADPQQAAAEIFNTLRTVDHTNIDTILIQGYQQSGIGVAIMNRLRKAASKIIECE